MRVLVTGASGLLGLNCCLMQTPRHEMIGVSHQTELSRLPFKMLRSDLTEEGAFANIIDQVRPELVINCAAMAVVDQCEELPQQAARLNAWLPGIAAGICKEQRISFIHLSTDAVFDGLTGGYSEMDPPHPLSVYAKTKLEGEWRALEANPEALIARVNFYGFSVTGKRSLAEFFLKNLLDNSPIHGFKDVFFSPLYVKHLVGILFTMAEKDLSGLYHVVCGEKISKYAFGCQIADRLSLDADLITPTSYRDAGLKARRSPNLFLNSSKLQAADITIPSIDQGLDDFIADYRGGWHTMLQEYLA